MTRPRPAASPNQTFARAIRLATGEPGATGIFAHSFDRLLSNAVSGAQAFARQFRQTGVALFVAAVTYFLGQQRLWPALMRGSPLLLVAVFAPLAITTFWIVRARLAGAYRAFANNHLFLEAQFKPV